jgi:regulator of protease activity HflC (stomatin/prohibitin superfamily)
VESGHLALKFNKFSGLQDTVHSEGWNWKVPYFENAIIFDVRQQPRTIECRTGSKDLQIVHCKMKVNIKPNPHKLPQIYRYLGMDYDGRVLPSVGNEVLKSVIARYSAMQLINERDQVSTKVRDLL